MSCRTEEQRFLFGVFRDPHTEFQWSWCPAWMIGAGTSIFCKRGRSTHPAPNPQLVVFLSRNWCVKRTAIGCADMPPVTSLQKRRVTGKQSLYSPRTDARLAVPARPTTDSRTRSAPRAGREDTVRTRIPAPSRRCIPFETRLAIGFRYRLAQGKQRSAVQ
jgi:hypothetical protein